MTQYTREEELLKQENEFVLLDNCYNKWYKNAIFGIVSEELGPSIMILVFQFITFQNQMSKKMPFIHYFTCK